MPARPLAWLEIHGPSVGPDLRVQQYVFGWLELFTVRRLLVLARNSWRVENCSAVCLSSTLIGYCLAFASSEKAGNAIPFCALEIAR
jgi:hypothetical protein